MTSPRTSPNEMFGQYQAHPQLDAKCSRPEAMESSTGGLCPAVDSKRLLMMMVMMMMITSSVNHKLFSSDSNPNSHALEQTQAKLKTVPFTGCFALNPDSLSLVLTVS